MRRQLITCSAAAFLLIGLAGCASPRATPLVPAKDTELSAAVGLPPGLAITPAFTPVAKAAAREAQRPLTDSLRFPPPASLPAELATPLAATDPAATVAQRPFQEVLAEFASRGQVQSAATEPSPEQRERALRRYIKGRQLLLDGDARSAIPELRAAAEIDAAAVEPLRELGEAYVAVGDRAQSLVAFRAAVELGLENARAFELLGRASMDDGEMAEAARYFARAVSAHPQQVDPLLPVITYVQLGKALAHEGYLRAAREAVALAFESKTQISASTRYSLEFGNIYRRQGELWREVGDIDLRLGDYASALEAYARSARLPVMDGIDITPRLAFAAMRSGRPSIAAWLVLEGIASRGGRVRSEDTAILSYLCQVASVRQAVAESLQHYRDTLSGPESTSPTIARALVRAQASVAKAEQARQILRTHLEQDPGDLQAIVALLKTCPDSPSILQEAARCSAQFPASAPFVAEALLRLDAPTDVDQLAKAGGDGALLTAAYLAAFQGEPRRGIELLSRISTRPPPPFVELARAQLHLSAGLLEPALASLQALQNVHESRILRGKARILQLLQKNAAALSALQQVLQDRSLAPGERVDILLSAADLAASLQKYPDAEQFLQQAAQLDPLDDRPLSELLDLYSGPLQEPAKLNQVIRQLRQEFSDGRGMRLLRARELLRREMLDAAEREILTLAEDEPSDPLAIQLLTAVWEQRFRSNPGAVDEARAWLKSRLDIRRYSPLYLMAMMILEVSGGAPEEAERQVREALSATDHPEISRMLERLLRDRLGRPQEADRLAIERLSGRRLLVPDAIELASIYAGQARLLDALGTLRESLPEDVTLTPDQARLAVAIAAAFGKDAVQKNHQEHLALARWLYDQLRRLGVALSPDDHEVRLVLFARSAEMNVRDLLEAAAHAVADHPRLGPAPYLRISHTLLNADRHALALQFIDQAIASMPDAPAEAWLEWFRVVVFAGDVEDARRFIAQADSSGKLIALVHRLRGDDPGPVSDYRAEAAYLLGNYLSAFNRRQQSERLYELTLEFDANHAWACNNLGYALADRNENLELAESLLERAHAALPEETAIVDSLGWLRYKQGILDDQTDDSGQVKRKGALSLLLAAAKSNYGKENPTILDHTGDALWLAGRADEAIYYWQIAQNHSMRRLQAPRADDPKATQAATGLSEAAAAEYRDIIQRTFVKRAAAFGGERVPVAAQAHNPEPMPPPTAAPPSPPGSKPAAGSLIPTDHE